MLSDIVVSCWLLRAFVCGNKPSQLPVLMSFAVKSDRYVLGSVLMSGATNSSGKACVVLAGAVVASDASLAFAQHGDSGPMDSSSMGGWMEQVVHRLGNTIHRGSEIVENSYRAPGEWASAFSKVFFSDGSALKASFGDLRLWIFLFLMILATEFLPRLLCDSYNRLETSLFWKAIKRLSFDLLGIGVAFALAAIAAATILTGPNADNEAGFELLWVVVRWRLTTMLVIVLLRPDQPDIRLLPVDTISAKRIVRTAYVSLAIIIGFMTVVPFFRRYGVSTGSAQATALVVGTISILFFIQALRQLNRAMPGHEGAILLLGGTMAVTTWAIWTLSIIFLQFDVYFNFLYAVLTSWLLLAIVRILALATRQTNVDGDKPRLSNALIAAIQRSLVVIATVVAVFIMARVWAVEVLGLVMDDQLQRISEALRSSFFVLITGYVAYEAIRTWAAARFKTDVALAGPETEDIEELRPRSRLSTIIPFLTGSLLIVVIMIAVLLGLSDLGFNTAPILAGAGIFGLAISFGSQALVRDIVSGIFYMIDDAFRVGEYIETGRLKGTVEKIMLRSLRVRHQNGQFHTIPYGQLGAVTNYSRDWSTIKFNLSLARDSDLEKVRKTAKQCGQALLGDPDFGVEFILPLKFQGVADIRENAIICRFKFTVRPLRPTQVQREALKRLHLAFVEKGIQFATHTVKVINDQVQEGEIHSAAAGAASITRLRPARTSDQDVSDRALSLSSGAEAVQR